MENKTNHTKKNGFTHNVLFRTKPEYAEALKEMAEEKFTSVNSLINSILEAKIKKIKKRASNIR